MIEGTNLLSADPNGFSDPYIKFKVDGASEKKQKTFIAPVTLNPVYNSSFSFLLKDSKFSGDVRVEAMDHDKANANDSLGHACIPLADIKEKGWLSGWFNLYQSDKKNAPRAPGRFFCRFVLDGDKSKLQESVLATHRAGLFEAVRRAEEEATAKAVETYLARIKQLPAPAPASASASTSTSTSAATAPESKTVEASAADAAPDASANPEAEQKGAPAVAKTSHSRPDPSFFSEGAVPLMDVAPPGTASTSLSFSYSTYARPAHLVPVTRDGTGHVWKVGCASWNVGNAPTSEPQALQTWLTGDCDLIAIGTQENDYKPRKGFKSHKDDYENQLAVALGADYVQIAAASMGQIHTHLFVRASLLSLVDLVQVDKANEATGIANVGTNKGGTCICVSVMGTVITFVSSHLAAHTTMVERRNADVQEIIQGLRLRGNHGVDVLHAGHHLFWMGDLNYRLLYAGEENKPDEAKFAEMLDMINKGQWDTLLESDQLIDSMRKEEVFLGFKDAPISFRPTFKVERDVEVPSYNEKRAPSYCDRVLWRSSSVVKDDVRCTSFTSAEKVMSSDHKPVFGVFEIAIRPQFPAIDDSRSTATLVFGPVDCASLPIGDINTSDPFIRFLCPQINKGKPLETNVKPNTLNPHWEGNEVPQLAFDITCPKRLAQTLVPFHIFDKDKLTESYLCAGELPMDKLDLFNEKWTELDIQLTTGGKKAGTLKTSVKVVWGLPPRFGTLPTESA